MAKQSGFKLFLRDNGLTIILFGLFLLFLVGQSIAGFRYTNEEAISHNEATIPFFEYIRSGDFVEAVFENWESEFLQMGALVVLTIFLRQKGSADSKQISGKEHVDTSSRTSIIHATTWNRRKKAVGNFLYSNSLSIVLFALFIVSFIIHALGGTAAHNEQALMHGETPVSVLSYLTTSQFWFESFQNWQSEFLSVGVLLLLSVFLRQRGSPESKAVGDPDSKTGE